MRSQCRWLALGCLLSPSLAQTFAPLVRPIHVGNPAAFDMARRRLVLFDRDGTTWEIDGGDLLPRAPQNGMPQPATRRDHAMCYDEARRRVLMFGGLGDSGPAFLDDTWVYDGNGWTQLPSGPAPAPRAGAALTWDATRNRAVMWGGAGGTLSTIFNDTWEHDGSGWLQRSPATSPVGRPGTMVFDRQRSVAVLLTLPNSGSPADTWEWNGTSWALRASLANAAADGSQTMVFDPSRHRTIVAGTTDRIFEWDGTAWTASAPLPQSVVRRGAASWFDPTCGCVTIAGGEDPTTFTERADQWQWNGQSLTLAHDDVGPLANSEVASRGVMFADPPRGRVVRFGGSGMAPSSETWAFANGVWSAVPSLAVPSARMGASATHDLLRGESLLFGGVASGALMGDTWSLGSSGWSERSTAGGPTPRMNAAMAADLVRNVVVLFGGQTFFHLDDTWEWNGTSWSLRPTTVQPTARSGAAMAYHPSLGKVVLFGGINFGITNNDTWTWDGTTWTELQPLTVPLRLDPVSMVSDLPRSRCVLVGAITVGPTQLQQVWTHDGTDWQLVFNGPRPAEGAWGKCVASAGLDGIVCTHEGSPAVIAELSFTPGRVATTGAGCGTPAATLMVRSRPRVGTTNGLELVANPGRAVLFGLDLASGSTPLGGGCTVWLSPNFLGLFQISDAVGFAGQPLSLPAGARGFDLFAQAAVLEPLSSNGLVLTQGLRLTLGD